MGTGKVVNWRRITAQAAVTFLLVCGTSVAQTTDDHDAHHPEQDGTVTAQPPAAATTSSTPDSGSMGGMSMGDAPPAGAPTGDDDHAAHHPEEDVTAPEYGATMPGAVMPGMGMMTPEMMQMMQRMMGQGGMPGMMEGMAGQTMPDGDAGPGMTGQTPMSGMMMCPMMRMMMSGQAEMGMPGMMGGQGILLGTPLGVPEEMTEDRVRALLEQQLTSLGNPRLRLGEIGTARDGSITAEIVTVDGSLVQKLAFNRYPGLVRQVVE